ncbi:LPXTG cell wall anchor domain-containing protein [Kitasatospora sp. NPDC093679]|uniref:LPXTG cell wall anchor domain-containing protein n=1 Tax=Kitasatospora sp. NPDC093679 TaxID=3154983 RepID=UPI00343149F0
MKLRRALAVSAATTLVTGAALAAAPAALAAPAAVPGIAKAAPAKTGAALSLKDFPGQITAGGAQVSFTQEITNTGGDAVLLPAVLLASADHLAVDQVKAQYKDPDSGVWKNATVEVDTPEDGSDLAVVLAQVGPEDSDQDPFISLPAGESVSIAVRLSLTAGAKPGKATATPAAAVFPVDESAEEPDADPVVTGPVQPFTIVAGTTTPTGKPTATPTGKPTGKPTATPTGKPTRKPTGKPTAPQGGALTTKRPSSTDVTKAKAQAGDRLANTGGGDHSGAIAAAGAGVLALGVGTLVVLRRRNAGAHRA